MTQKILIADASPLANLVSPDVSLQKSPLAQLAEDFGVFDCEVTYLCARDITALPLASRLTVSRYASPMELQNLLCELAVSHTTVILGGPSIVHPVYSAADSAGNTLAEVAKYQVQLLLHTLSRAAPSVKLFGFNIVPAKSASDDLVRDSFKILRTSPSLAMVASDSANKRQQLIITKDRGVHPVPLEDLASHLWAMMADTYYQTEVGAPAPFNADDGIFRSYVGHYLHNMPELFKEVEGGYLLGTIAMRSRDGKGFWTNAQDKKELSGAVFVREVDHDKRLVRTAGGVATASAPLLDRMFRENPSVDLIIHAHQQLTSLPTQSYAPPGSVRDTFRDVSTSLNIDEHGCFVMLELTGEMV